jgi:hypothetical protein
MNNEALDPLYAAVFTDPENGTPDNITQAGCLALARLGKEAWNAWRSKYPARGEAPNWENIADFSKVDFRKYSIIFDGFIFGDNAIFWESQFGDLARFKGAQFGNRIEFTDAQFGFMAQFEDAQFGNGVDFKGAKFGDMTNFKGARFDFNATFMSAQFGNHACFIDAKFDIGAKFAEARFAEQAQFDGTRFGDDVQFTGTQFGDFASFARVKFDGDARFVGAQFGNWAEFTGSRFSKATWFSGVQFRNAASFYGAWFGNNAKFVGMNWEDLHHTYSEQGLKIAKAWAEQHGLSPNTFKSISFAGARFDSQVDFSGRMFTGTTSFGRLDKPITLFDYDRCGNRVEKKLPLGRTVSFGKAPLFHNCKLHQDTMFDGAIFPEPSSDPIENDIAARAYRTLKSAFSQHQATHDEQRFFRLEMAEEAQRAPQYARRLLFRLYSFFSDYGFSVSRPFVWLWLIPLLVVVQILTNFTPSISWQAEWQIRYDQLQFALIQALPLPALDKWSDSLRQYLFPTASGTWQGIMLTGILMLHKALSLLAVFLMGLALRNLFKMK